MNVPFISSGALSRAHYTLVRRVESANSHQLADQYLLAEVQSMKYRLAHPTLSLKQCKESLIILLYCSTAIASGFPNGELDFALPHAVNLAETGESVQDKRIGYLFCANVMHPEHELQLMLVNTLRKVYILRTIMMCGGTYPLTRISKAQPYHEYALRLIH